MPILKTPPQRAKPHHCPKPNCIGKRLESIRATSQSAPPPPPIKPAQAIDALPSWRNPFDWARKLNALVKRAREPPQIAWCFCSLADEVLSGAYACADFSLRTLAGDTSSGNKGHADAFIFRLRLIHHMGHVLLDRLEPSPQMRKKHWDASESHTNLTPIRRGAESRPVLEGRKVHDFLLRLG